MIDRSKIAQALAKAIAYKQCGKQADAEAIAAPAVLPVPAPAAQLALAL